MLCGQHIQGVIIQLLITRHKLTQFRHAFVKQLTSHSYLETMSDIVAKPNLHSDNIIQQLDDDDDASFFVTNPNGIFHAKKKFNFRSAKYEFLVLAPSIGFLLNYGS